MAAKNKTTVKVKKKATVKRKQTKAKSEKKEMIQTHAMEEEAEFEKTSLDQIWGDTGLSKYGTQDESQYTGKIRSMNRSDLHAHAIKLGVLPIDNRELLTTRLIREFKKYILAYRKPKQSDLKKDLKVSRRSRSILAEGK